MHTSLRILPAVLCCLAWSVSQAADSFDNVTRLAQGGAPQLALARVEREQPPRSDLPHWLQWEGLRLSLLNRVHRPQEVLTRVGALPAGAPSWFLPHTQQEAAEAALALGRGETARTYLSRLLWQAELPPAAYKEVRWQVIKSYLVQKQVAEAYPLMLRYSQEFAPLAPAEAAAFVRELLSLGAATEAVSWLSALEPGSPLRLMTELRSGLLPPEQAEAAARAALSPGKPGKKSGQTVKPAKTDEAGYWAVILAAATVQKDDVQATEARERLLNGADLGPGNLAAVSAEDLWQAYETLAQEQANRAQLLQGDDMAWFVFADGQEKSSPVVARALYARLAVRARAKPIRENALARFIVLLDEAGLDSTAVRLFATNGHFPDGSGLAPQALVKLGELAQQTGRLSQAVTFWRRAEAAPDGLTDDDWQLKRARLFAAAGAYPELGAAARRLLAGKTGPSPDLAKAVVELTQDLKDVGQSALARELLHAALPLADPADQRQILTSLGELTELVNDPLAAAEYYLQGALLAEKPDASALQAHYQAACNLVRAGLVEDAKREYQLVRQMSRDASLQAAARRALARLP